eukprot:COSAG01_NODE_39120_length_480_cov_20.876640_1_plen_69_part_10
MRAQHPQSVGHMHAHCPGHPRTHPPIGVGAQDGRSQQTQLTALSSPPLVAEMSVQEKLTPHGQDWQASI